MAKSPNWTVEELAILREVYPLEGCSTNLLSKLPNRNSKGISIKTSRLGIKVLSPWNKKLTTEEYLAKLEGRNISLVEEYIKDCIEIMHKCTTCGTEWKSRPNNILNGHGCPCCNKGFGSNYATNLPAKASIYLVEITLNNGEHFLKLGVTSNTSNIRFINIKSELNSLVPIVCFDILKQVYSDGKTILDKEYLLLNSKHRAQYICSVPFKGCTELFNISNKQFLLDALNENI